MSTFVTTVLFAGRPVRWNCRRAFSCPCCPCWVMLAAALSGAASSFRMLGPLSPLLSCPVDFLGACHTRRSLFPCPWELGRRPGTGDGSVVGGTSVPVNLQTLARRRPFPLVVSGTQRHGKELSPSRSTVFIECWFCAEPCSGILCGLRQTYL